MAIANLLAGVTSALIPIPPSAPLATVFVILRACTNVAGLRSAFVASMFLPAERTAFIGLANVVRTSSQSIGPVITGALAESRKFWVSFVLSGSMCAAYGVGILVLFTGHESSEERHGDDDVSRGIDDRERPAGTQRQDGTTA